MCNMVLTEDNVRKHFKFIVFNIAFSETGGKFTKDLIIKRLENIGIEADMERLNAIFERWLEDGLIFEDVDGYVVNLATI